MRQELCLCDQIPSLPITTRLILVMTKRELKVPTNTGRLATLALPNSVILVRGELDRPYDVREHLIPGAPSVLLYPCEGAAELTPAYAAQLGAPLNLIVLDGNWRQTSKMRTRDATLAAMPVVTLPAGPATQYRVRKESKVEGLATIEAIARSLGAIEGPWVRTALESLLTVMVERVLSSRGQAGG
jgi:DTW domain-containing protein